MAYTLTRPHHGYFRRALRLSFNWRLVCALAVNVALWALLAMVGLRAFGR